MTLSLQFHALLNTCYSQAGRHISSDVRYMVARDNSHQYYASQTGPIDNAILREVLIQCKTR